MIAKTATVEVTPEQAELLTSAQGAGQLSLALRPLGDSEQADVSGVRRKKSLGADGPVAVIRYGMIAPSNPAKQETQQ